MNLQEQIQQMIKDKASFGEIMKVLEDAWEALDESE